jgi:hypothetical protein
MGISGFERRAEIGYIAERGGREGDGSILYLGLVGSIDTSNIF